MLKEWNDLFQHNLNLSIKTTQSLWLDYMNSEQFLKSMKLFHIYYFDHKEKMDELMEDVWEQQRIASKEDVRDLVDGQRLVIDLLEELTTRVEKLEQSIKSSKKK